MGRVGGDEEEMETLTMVGTKHCSDPNLFTITSHRILLGAGEEGRKSLLLFNVTVSSVATGPLLAKGPLSTQPESGPLHCPLTFSVLEAKGSHLPGASAQKTGYPPNQWPKSWISDSSALPDLPLALPDSRKPSASGITRVFCL